MAKYSINQKVIYRKEEGAITKTGTIKRLRFDDNVQRYEIQPDEGGDEILVSENNIVQLAT